MTIGALNELAPPYSERSSRLRLRKRQHPDGGMRRTRRENNATTQEVLFQEPNSSPSVPTEVLAEVLAALAELLLDAATPRETEVADERKDL